MQHHFFLLFFLLTIVYGSLFGQAGCQDPQATNYNPNAITTDSSCLYPLTNWSSTNRIAALANGLNESSSLLLTDGRLFTNLDSGNPNQLFQIDSATGQIVKTSTIWNYNNVDWEALTADSQFIYIGDFGNNDGNRTNLRVIIVKKSDVYHPDSLLIRGEAINFNYSDQTQFTISSKHNFDCEAFFYFGGNLHLFTKNRGNHKTTYYTLSTQPGTETALGRDSFFVNGLITDAHIRKDGKAAFLLGYDQSAGKVFGWILTGFPGTRFFSGNKRRIELPGLTTSGQAEGVTFVDENRLWISNEKLSIIPARVRQINIRNLIQPFLTAAHKEYKGTWPKVIFYSESGPEIRNVSLGKISYRKIYLDGRIDELRILLPGEVSPLASQNNGVYILQYQLNDHYFYQKILGF